MSSHQGSDRPHRLDRLLRPRSIAVVGASARPDSFGERLSVEALRSTGAARVGLVNPRYDSVQGQPCVPSLADLPEPPDLVLLGVPDLQLPEQLATAAAAGAGGAVIFGAAAGLGDRIREAAGEMAVCGGGCMGFANPTHGIRAMGFLERPELPPGPIALVTHSGSVFSAMLRSHRRLEYSVAVSSGQELVTTTGDYLDWALCQPETAVIALFLETIRDAPALRSALGRAAEADLPVVALTVGGSPTGRAMVSAHSGAVAGSDAAWEALFATYGVHRTRDVEEFVDTLELFAIGRRPLGPGGIATVHDSGAERVLVADLAADEGIEFASLTPSTEARLTEVLDPSLTPSNPLDAWSGRGLDTETLFGTCLEAMAADPAVAAVALAVDLVEEYDDSDDAYPRALLKTAALTDKPIVALSTVAAAVDQSQAGPLREAGIPVLEGARSALRAVRHLLEHSSGVEPVTAAPADAERARLWVERLGGSSWVDGAQSLALLAAYSIPVVPTEAVAMAADAVAAADRLGYPVVLKTDAPGIEHRVAADGVRLGLADSAGVAAAYDDLAARCGPRVLVQRQLDAAPEIALGLLRDPGLGPILLVALGGSRIEELATRAVALPPLDEPAAQRLLARLSGDFDRESVVAPVLGLSALAIELGGVLDALDINPLLLTPQGAVAVDALVQPRGSQ